MGKAKDQQYTIAIMTGEDQTGFADNLMRGFYSAAREEGVNIVWLVGPQIPEYCADIVTSSLTGNYRYHFNSIYQYAHLIKPDAMVITRSVLRSFESEEEKQAFLDQFSDIPYIIVGDKSKDDKVPHYFVDNYNGMRGCVEHLVKDHEYRKIAFLSGPKGNAAAEIRLKAYQDVMQENGIQVTDSMIAYGDFTDRVEDQVLFMLKKNPNLEAIVCASDYMAQGCYRACTSQNLVVGRDIAVTGFDDSSAASTMNPPLTTVSQNNFEMSATALRNAIALCRGEEVESYSISTVFRKRCSCGCRPVKVLTTRYVPEDEMADFVDDAAEQLSEYMFSSIAYGQEFEDLKDAFTEYIYYIYNAFFTGKVKSFSMGYLMDVLKKIASYPYIKSEVLLDNITQVLQIMMANAKDAYSQGMVASIISSTQQYVHAMDIEKLQKEIYTSGRRAWFVPTFARDLASEVYLSRPQNIFFHVMNELKKMAVRRAYFFSFKEPVIYEAGEKLNLADVITVVAYFDSYDMTFFHKVEQPEFTKENGMMSFIQGTNPTCLVPVVLFAEQKQYGIMMCEVEYEDIPFLQKCCVQLGTLFHFIELNLKEQETQRELQETLRVVKEQNTILSFISEYDELTKLLNRRGFVEQALSLMTKSSGSRAFLIFGDLDHLKEINDVFGHSEGDFAIKHIADRLRAILPEGTICGRIGGDEYVAFVLSDEEDFRERIEREFKAAGNQFNESSDKPYYVEMSLGIQEFICGPDVDFSEMMKKSDELLYVAKATRRKSIKK